MSFCPTEIADEIRKRIPDFSISYEPDFRQAIADTWPKSIDDSVARADWGWQPAFDLRAMTSEILTKLPKPFPQSFEG
jgi:nucleoside-diphosphate-sugar epimerase